MNPCDGEAANVLAARNYIDSAHRLRLIGRPAFAHWMLERARQHLDAARAARTRLPVK